MTGEKINTTSNQMATFEITVQGKLDPNWVQPSQFIAMNFNGEVTTLSGTVADQSALRGLLCYLWDFNLTLVSVVLDYPKNTLSKVG